MKDWKITVELTSKELNYIDAGLRDSIAGLKDIATLGNVPHLLWFTKRLRGKLHRINHKALRAHMTKEQKRRVTRYIRKAFKQIRGRSQR